MLGAFTCRFLNCLAKLPLQPHVRVRLFPYPAIHWRMQHKLDLDRRAEAFGWR